MNKYQEALNGLKTTIIIKKYYTGKWVFETNPKHIETLQELVDKATPIRPIENILGTGKYLVEYTHECSKCGNYLEVSNKYCSECGNELDWSEEEREEDEE